MEDHIPRTRKVEGRISENREGEGRMQAAHLKTDTIELGKLCSVSSSLPLTLHCCQSSSKEFQHADVEGSVNLKVKDTVF